MAPKKRPKVSAKTNRILVGILKQTKKLHRNIAKTLKPRKKMSSYAKKVIRPVRKIKVPTYIYNKKKGKFEIKMLVGRPHK